MKKRISNTVFSITFIITLILCLENSFAYKVQNYPDQKNIYKPWTFWWWMGSAVDKDNITLNLERIEETGIGGVHIIPIYGVKGYEEKYIDFLSPKWIEMLTYTADECERLGLGFDMTLGTGWPFGGPWVNKENSSQQFIDTILNFNEEENISIDVNQLIGKLSIDETDIELINVSAFFDNQRVDLTDHIENDNFLRWKTPEECKLIFIFSKKQVQQVKRAAPGGKGNVVDPFSVAAMNDYLYHFERIFENYHGKKVRAFYHDSYEYYGADWTNNLITEFEERRGYNLLDVLPELLSEDDSEKTARIKLDYRHTISELHKEFILRVNEWSNKKGSAFRNQAHGSPANLLDIYAAADIPECEVFGTPRNNIPGVFNDSLFTRNEIVDPLILKFASSSAHVSGKNLVSSETGTWINEHFRESLSQLKNEIDLLFVAGINHVFFHGTTYSPKNAEWPGWQFYASTNLSLANSFRREMPSLNKYIERCQKILQDGKPDNDLLVYFPVWDLWHSSKGKLINLQIHHPEEWLFETNFYKTAKQLSNGGYSFDYVSDEQIQNVICHNGNFVSGGNQYKGIVIPSCRFMPVQTMQRLHEFVKNGGKVFFVNDIPRDVPGYFNYSSKQDVLEKIKKELMKTGDALVGSDIINILEENGLCKEQLADFNIDFIRRKLGNEKYYFIVNQHSKMLDDWVKIGNSAQSVIIIDPITGKSGKAQIRKDETGKTNVYLQLEPGASLILKILNETVEQKEWKYYRQARKGFEVSGKWNVDFIEGGPILPENRIVDNLKSWTEFLDDETKYFAGTARYSIKFSNPNPLIKNWVLDLGKVCETARVIINGREIGIVFSIPPKIFLENILTCGEKELVIEVENLPSNRIKYLDEKKVGWKNYHDINFVNINYKKFDASSWVFVDSGLLGPVVLYPAEKMEFD